MTERDEFVRTHGFANRSLDGFIFCCREDILKDAVDVWEELGETGFVEQEWSQRFEEIIWKDWSLCTCRN